MSENHVSSVQTALPANFNFGPYYNVQASAKLTFDNQRVFIIGIAGGYNAMGLIGTECNGIFVLDDVKKKVLADELACQRGCFLEVSREQQSLYDRLLKMTWNEFRDFINSQNRARYKLLDKPKRRLPLPKVFAASQFAGHAEGKFWTAEDKAKWANAFVRFVRSGFDPDYYNKDMYFGLYQHMGFIAHYDMHGFWEARFSSLARQIETVSQIAEGIGRHGHERYTWSDVSRAIGGWLEKEKILEKLVARQASEATDRELKLRDELVAKHGPG